MSTIPPSGLGFLSDTAQSAYYPGQYAITPREVAEISRLLEQHSVFPENTRIQKIASGDTDVFEVLQASIEKDVEVKELKVPTLGAIVRLRRGDHSEELTKICVSLLEARKFVANQKQADFLSQYVESFKTENLETYRISLRTWIKDKSPRVENIFGFVEPYRDPHGTRAEFEGLVAIMDLEETRRLTKLVEHSSTFIKRLPWAGGSENDGKGPFEKALFEPPDFTSIHCRSNRSSSELTKRRAALAYCSSIIFPGINLPNVSAKLLHKPNSKY